MYALNEPADMGAAIGNYTFCNFKSFVTKRCDARISFEGVGAQPRMILPVSVPRPGAEVASRGWFGGGAPGDARISYRISSQGPLFLGPGRVRA